MKLQNKTIQRVLSGINFSGVDRLFQQFDQALGMILMFHHVSDADEGKFAPNAHLTIHPDFLDAVIRLLKRRSIDIVSLDEARQRIFNPVNDRRFAVFTFDDGYRDNLTTALPVMKKYDVPFTVYVATGLIEGTADLWWRGIEALIRQQEHCLVQTGQGPLELDCSSNVKKQQSFAKLLNYLQTEVEEEEVQQKVRELCWLYKIDLDTMRADAMMTWDEIAQIAADPLCTIGAHTIQHPMLSRLSAKDARQEMLQGAAVLHAELGAKPAHFAFPYGFKAAAGPREFDIARKLRFKTAVTTRPGMIFAEHRDHMTALPRISVNGLFQRMRYFAPLTSGLPTRLANKGRKVNVSA